MKKSKLLSVCIILFILASCDASNEDNAKELVLDSLKHLYAGKFIGITLSNNQSGTDPLTSKYAYVDESKSDFAFELHISSADEKRYILSEEEAWVKVKTIESKEQTDMVLIEDVKLRKKGYVDYSFVYEFTIAKYYGN